jgi:hypothetical protein
LSRHLKPLPRIFDITTIEGREEEIKEYLDSVIEACSQRKY